MNNDDAAGVQRLRALCTQAAAQAAQGRMPAGRRAGAAAGRTTGGRARLLKPVLFGCSGLLALAVVAAQFDTAAPASAPPPVAAQRPPLLPMPTAAATLASPSVQWQGSELLVDIEQLPLPQAIEVLAHTTHTTVAGSALLLQAQPVTLHGRFADTPAAWQQLLRGHAGFSISCAAARCQLWITSATAASAAGAGTGAPAARPDAAPQPDDNESQPGGSC